MQTDRYGRLKPVTQGVWERIGHKHYQHVAGFEVVYRCNSWNWEVVGGSQDGHRYQTLSVAQHAATLHLSAASREA